MTIHSLITLSDTTPVRLTNSGLHSGRDITIQNVDSEAYVYIGGTGVSSNDYGYRINPDSAISFSLLSPDTIYAVSDTNESKIAVMHVGIIS